MGVALTELLARKQIEPEFLQGKTLVVDSPMWLYQFLSSIRQRDGSLLTDSHGNVTSHLMGLFTRISNLMQLNIKLAFAFDGRPPKLKNLMLEKRKEMKINAMKNFETAKEAGDEELMKRYASRTSRLNEEMISEAKKLISAFGSPVISAPSEAEAQASYIVKNKDAYAISTNDADSLLFNAPLIVRNLNMVGKKKKLNRLGFDTVKPDLINLDENLNKLGISHDQLIVLAMLIGTDYNAGGIKGVGPKSALKLVKEHGNDFDSLFDKLKWHEFFEYPWTEVFDLIKNMPVDKDYKLGWAEINREEMLRILVDNHDFSAERVSSQIDILTNEKQKKRQKGLGEFFG